MLAPMVNFYPAMLYWVALTFSWWAGGLQYVNTQYVGFPTYDACTLGVVEWTEYLATEGVEVTADPCRQLLTDVTVQQIAQAICPAPSVELGEGRFPWDDPTIQDEP